MSRRFPWATWSNERLLQLRIKDLGLTLEGTWLEPRIDALYETLERRGFRIRPHIWLSEEWFSPLGVPGFAIPFYLAHPVSYTHLRAHETGRNLVCRLLLEKK